MTSKARQVKVQLRLEDEQIAWLRLDVQNSAMAIFGNMEFLTVNCYRPTFEAPVCPCPPPPNYLLGFTRIGKTNQAAPENPEFRHNPEHFDP